MSDEVLVKVEGVSKKFCKSLKRSLWYGVQDVSAEMFGRKGHHDELRKNEFWAVNDVSFELKRGECLGLIGPNGAGKSTLLKMLNGLVKPDKGRITMRGRVGALIELGAGFNPVLTARENIYINGSVLGFSKKEIDKKFDAIVDFAEIEEFIDTPVQNFSSGMKVRLGFAVAAQMEPDVLLIDEVLAVGDVGFRTKCLNLISKIANNSSIILVSHSMPDVARTASRVMLVSKGRTLSFDQEVAQGIEKYTQQFDSQVEHGSETTSCRLLSFNLVMPSSELSDTCSLRYLDSIELEISLLLDAGTRKAALNISIEDFQKRSIAQISSSKSQFYLSGSTSPQTVRIMIDKIPLSLGSYTFSIYCVEYLSDSRRGQIFFYRHDVARLNVSDSQPGFSSIQIPASWSLIEVGDVR